MITSVELFNGGMVAYFLAFLTSEIYTFSKSSWASKLATTFAWLGVVVQGAGFIVRGLEKAKVNMVSDW
ncbi:MAG: c-type cytochrome biogenesis protein CcsB, partial [Desulfurobacteriaceae bacterium]